jgi:hypothetical protein
MTQDEILEEFQRGGEAMGKTLDRLLAAQPFRPLRLGFMGKLTEEIDDPAGYQVQGALLHVKLPNRRAVCSLIHLASIEVLPPADVPVIVQRTTETDTTI